jgi:hypothetical protein
MKNVNEMNAIEIPLQSNFINPNFSVRLAAPVAKAPIGVMGNRRASDFKFEAKHSQPSFPSVCSKPVEEENSQFELELAVKADAESELQSIFDRRSDESEDNEEILRLSKSSQESFSDFDIPNRCEAPSVQ